MHRILLLASASFCLLASPAFAAPTAADLPTGAAAATAGPAVVAPTTAAREAARIERLQRAELNARMDAVIAASKKTLAGLQSTIDLTTDPATLKELEDRMAQVKGGTTIDLLRVQSTFARESGRIAQADEIDGQIDAILHPKRPASNGGVR